MGRTILFNWFSLIEVLKTILVGFLGAVLNSLIQRWRDRKEKRETALKISKIIQDDLEIIKDRIEAFNDEGDYLSKEILKELPNNNLFSSFSDRMLNLLPIEVLESVSITYNRIIAFVNVMYATNAHENWASLVLEDIGESLKQIDNYIRNPK